MMHISNCLLNSFSCCFKQRVKPQGYLGHLPKELGILVAEYLVPPLRLSEDCCQLYDDFVAYGHVLTLLPPLSSTQLKQTYEKIGDHLLQCLLNDANTKASFAPTKEIEAIRLSRDSISNRLTAFSKLIHPSSAPPHSHHFMIYLENPTSSVLFLKLNRNEQTVKAVFETWLATAQEGVGVRAQKPEMKEGRQCYRTLITRAYKEGVRMPLPNHWKHLTAAKLWVQQGGDVNAQDIVELRTPLHKAALAGDTCFVNKLLELGANRAIRDLYDLTPLDAVKWAQQQGALPLGYFNAIQEALSPNRLS
jgi:hypothetical protein